MTDDLARRTVAEYWMEKANAALASARSEMNAGRYDFAANRVYYACFYSASAVLLEEGQRFRKHAGVRGAVHQFLVKSGRLDAQWGRIYDRVFESRQLADYLELVEFEEHRIRDLLSQSEGFVAEMKQLLAAKGVQ